MRYQIQQRLLSLTARFDIANGAGEPILEAVRKFGLRPEYTIRSLDGREFVSLRQKMWSWRPRFEFFQEGRPLAVIQRRLTFRPTYTVDLVEGGQLTVTGSFWQYNYVFASDGVQVAVVSRAMWTLRDSYGVEVLDPRYDAVVLATVIAIDAIRSQSNQST